ncbi:ABC-type transport auxiliary lipoprotein family protein [soil metagenome]
MIGALFNSRARRFAVAAAVGISLSGCALLSTPKPVQTYRFGGETAAEVEPGAAARPVAVALRRIDFPEASKGDRILGVTGSEAAYIKGARWISPAEILFNDALEASFAAQPDKVRLIGRREVGASARVLSLDVTTFEARYDVAGAVPTVVITARARLVVLPERSVTSEKVFTISQPATENRVSAIVEAFDVATRDLNTQVVEWTAQEIDTTATPTAPGRPSPSRG